MGTWMGSLPAVLAVVCAAAGCGGDDGAAQVLPADGPIRFAASVAFFDNLPHDDFTVRVAGELVPMFGSYETTFPDRAAFFAAEVPLELWAGDLLLDREPIRPRDHDPCGSPPPDERLTSFAIGFCGYAHGELRYASDELDYERYSCISDGFCLSCFEDNLCRDGRKCTSSFADPVLTYSRLECLPAGPHLLGEPCAWTQNAEGRWVDDCAVDTVCFDRTCHARCCFGITCGGQCMTPAGHAPELKICVPPA